MTFLAEHVGFLLCQSKASYCSRKATYFSRKATYCSRRATYCRPPGLCNPNEDDDLVTRRTDKGGKGIVQDLCRTFHGLQLLFFQPIDGQCHHPIELLHAEVVVVVLLEYGRRIDDMRGILTVVAVYVTTVAELSATVCNSSVLCVGFDTFNEVFNAFCRDL